MFKKIFIFTLCSLALYASQRDFSFHKMQGEPNAPTLLVIGGVHGDEPGGYFAPVLMLKHYDIKKGSVYVVPNLNFDSIVEHRRGKYGDMNRKFADIQANDPDFRHVERIKELITLPEVAFVSNLHDGRGFYRHKWESAIFNPSAWGQSYIIDQHKIENVEFGNLDEITANMESILNKDLHENHHTFNVKNTETKEVDEAMQRSLTYYAVTNQKPAIAVETSKNITELDLKVIYQLRSFEALMQVMGIEYTKNIELTRDDVQKSLSEYGTIKLNDKFTIELSDTKFATRFVPMKKEDNIIEFSHPLGSVIKRDKYYDIQIGHLRVGTIYPQYFDFNCDVNSAKLDIDGEVKEIKFGEIVDVQNNFNVLSQKGIRVNVIGFVTKNKVSQDDITVKKGDIIERFAMDNQNKTFRIEFYDGNSFCGMIGVRFQ
ncbi:MAG: hypothetical protein M0P43_03390 [Arcobacteraceae bacterium]|nr:hypothetical protein [Arcobacteraceae bacterium]MDY0327664.1 M99 family carboxypeptidase catalytic domain-containing protein [Arcobacteraceae bacterium]